MKVYLDNGATTKVDEEVVKTMLPYFTKEYGNPSSLHGFGREAKEVLEKARETIAKRINAEPDEIVFTSGGSESDNIAIKEIAFPNMGKKNHIITTKIEHPAILDTCNFLEKMGFKVTYLNVDNEGFISLDELEKAITDKTVLISVIHANNEIGVIQDLEKIGAICRKHNVFFHTDSVQSFTKVPIDVKKMNIDLASFSSHKIHGPKGIGVLYVRKGLKMGKLIHGGHQENDKRAGTENIPGIVGMAKAVELAEEEHVVKMTKMRDYLVKELLKIPHSMLNGPKKHRLCNNVSISFKFIEGESILMHLDFKGIAVSTGSACSSQSLEPSHVLLAIGLKHEEAHGTIRFTLSRFTTKEELDYTIKEVKEVVENLRKISPMKEGFVYNKDEYAHTH